VLAYGWLPEQMNCRASIDNEDCIAEGEHVNNKDEHVGLTFRLTH